MQSHFSFGARIHGGCRSFPMPRGTGTEGFVNPGSAQLFDSDRSWRLVLIFCLVNSSMHNLQWLLVRPLESFQSYNVQKICVNKIDGLSRPEVQGVVLKNDCCCPAGVADVDIDVCYCVPLIVHA
ncbi:uncharacterized protein [Aegilops tauschii subsp. strangulata]|uniref:uncharacterized protein n=1 Tax=Aegilops tauschii subsp. strangulata TaxID=200361 RepID=UPI001E1CAFC0|nr:uncharacterized protein LOC120969800 [Aegilops tauschii subsp. strangulata]